MHQEIHGPDVGDEVEVLGYKLHQEEREYDGSSGIILDLFSDRKGIKCATVKVVSQIKERSGKRPFPMDALKKL